MDRSGLPNTFFAMASAGGGAGGGQGATDHQQQQQQLTEQQQQAASQQSQMASGAEGGGGNNGGGANASQQQQDMQQMMMNQAAMNQQVISSQCASIVFSFKMSTTVYLIRWISVLISRARVCVCSTLSHLYPSLILSNLLLFIPLIKFGGYPALMQQFFQQQAQQQHQVSYGTLTE